MNLNISFGRRVGYPYYRHVRRWNVYWNGEQLWWTYTDGTICGGIQGALLTVLKERRHHKGGAA